MGKRGHVLPLKRSSVKVGSDTIAIGSPQGMDFSLRARRWALS
ncbi:hypothetical protein CyaNS01_02873 [Cyanobium sp. NS01]|jgi:hypothetical protein|nr:hypothetical protein CyaNS01_02873 [Cyanobium sp. NS01]